MLDDAVALYRLPPAEFIAARDALVKSLKADKRTEEAAAVKALARPKLGEHALNMAAAEAPDVVDFFAGAVAAITAAQSEAIGGGSADALRSATVDLRDATEALIDAAAERLPDGHANPTQRDEIRTTLRGLTNEAGVHLLVLGIIGSTKPGEPSELFAGAPAPARRVTPKPQKRGSAKLRRVPLETSKPAALEATPKAKASAAEARERERRIAARARATTTLDEAERVVAAARKVVDKAQAELARAEAKRDKAKAALDDLP
jgi:hypothetical protein